MNSALWKDNLREIKKSLPRFLSIFAIIALGVAFFIGIQAAGPSMVETGRQIYDDNNLPDGHVLSTAGLNESDIDLLSHTEGLIWLPMQSVTTVIRPSDENIKLFTYNGKEESNFYKIIEGRMVEESNEIVLDSKYLESINDGLDDAIEIGDWITLDSPDSSGFSLNSEEFEVVGFARNPMYIERVSRSENANVFGVISDEAVSADLFSEAYYWIDEAREYEAYSDDYVDIVGNTVASLEDKLVDRPEIRLLELKDEISEAIHDGQVEIKDGHQTLADAEKELSDAQKDLEEGHIQIMEGQHALAQGANDYDEGLKEFKDGVREYHQGRFELADARSQLSFNEKIYEDGLASYQAGLATFNEEIASAEGQLNDAQVQLNQGSQEAQAGYQQLVAGQEALDIGYGQLDTGRQQLLDQLGLATGGQIPPEDLLAAIETQIDVLNDFIALLDQVNNGTNPAIASWISSLMLERDLLVQNLEELTNIVAGLPELNNPDQTLADLELSLEQKSTLEALLNTELSPEMSIDHVITLLNNRIEEFELGDSESNEFSNITTKVQKIRTLENQIAQTQATLLELEESRHNLGDLEQLHWQVSDLESQNVSYNQQIIALQESNAVLETQLNSSELTEAERVQLESELTTNQSSINELVTLQQANQSEIESLNQQITQINTIDQEIIDLENQLIADQEALGVLQAELQTLLAELGIDELPEDVDLGELQTELQQLVDAVTLLQAGQAELDAQSAVLNAGWQDYYAGLAQLEQGQSAINQGWTELNAQRALGQGQLDTGYAELTEGRNALDVAYDQFEAGSLALIDGKQVLDESHISLLDGQRELEEGKDEALAGRMELMRGDYLYNSNRHTFEQEYAGAVSDLKDGEADLADAQTSLDGLAEPTYIVADRTSSNSYQTLNNNAEQLGIIANIFPVLFLAIAVLVTFTTIKRMASEQRNYMGTMKQLGYHNSTIIQKFVVYAGSAGILGTIVGIIIGYLVFPGVILNAYNMLYYFDNPQIEVLWGWNIFVAIIALATALIPAIVTPLNMLRTKPANLLLPEPPKSGKKIVLERFPLIWNRLSFNAKMTVRNLLRYKGRNSMTLIGVAGCTMLIVTGFGISNTISSIVEEQFGEIQTFEGMVFQSSDLNKADIEEVQNELTTMDAVESYMPVLQEDYDVVLENGQTQSVTVTVPMGDLNQFSEFVTLAERDQAPNPNALKDDGPFITERIGELLNLSAGEAFEVENNDYEEFTIENYTITENYASHYLYVTPEQYMEIFNKEAITNSYLVKYSEGINQKQVEEKLMQNEHIMATVDFNTIATNFAKQMGSLDLITLVLIISAAALSFIVLYNLTNINVAERIRELSTIKVLGFYDREVSMYIFNEVLVLTFIGGILGLVFGTVMNHFILKTMQMPDILFHPTITSSSYLISFIISFVFSSIVMLAMHRKLKKIDMVEALKGVD